PELYAVPFDHLVGLVDGLVGIGDGGAATDAAFPSPDSAAGAVDLASLAGDLADGVSVSGMIGPSGGTLSHPGGARLDVPAGALATTTSVTITALATPPARGFRWVGPVFRFTPSGL